MKLTKQIITCAIIIIATIFIVKSCESPRIEPQRNEVLEIENFLLSVQIKNDSLKVVRLSNEVVNLKRNVVKSDSLRKYSKSNYNSLKLKYVHTICDTLIMACDSVIANDSLAIVGRDYIIDIQDSLIYTQTNIIQNQSSIIGNKNTIIETNLIDLKLAKKEIKKQKRSKIAIFGIAILSVVATVLVLR